MKSQNLTLSVIILTHRNDSRFIKSLKSAQPATEILILDFDSQNDWQKLKKEFHFKVINRKGPINNFAQERNLALKEAKQNWVFFLDSDEEILSESWDEIAESISSEEIDGYFIQRNDIFYNKILRFGETGGVKFLRLIRRNKAKYLRPVHESARVNGETEQTMIQILHHSHQNITEFIRDIVRYANLEAEYQNDDKLNPRSLGIKTIAYPKAKFLYNYLFK